MKKNKHSLKISRSDGDITIDGYPIATYSNDKLKILKNLLEKVLCEVNEYIKYQRMKELKVGERFSVTLEIVEQNSCDCCFFGHDDTCHNPTLNGWADGFYCEPENRSDGKSIIFQEVKE